MDLKTDVRCSRYLAEKAKAEAGFFRKHPGARIDDFRLLAYKEGDHEW